MYALWIFDLYKGDDFIGYEKFETAAEAEYSGQQMIKRHAERCELAETEVQFAFKVIAI